MDESPAALCWKFCTFFFVCRSLYFKCTMQGAGRHSLAAYLCYSCSHLCISLHDHSETFTSLFRLFPVSSTEILVRIEMLHFGSAQS